jgi:hypothetical protein
MTTAASEDRRAAIEIAALMVVVACLLTGLAVTMLSLFGPAIGRLSRGLLRVPAAENPLRDRHWRASPPATDPAGSPPGLARPPAPAKAR